MLGGPITVEEDRLTNSDFDCLPLDGYEMDGVDGKGSSKPQDAGRSKPFVADMCIG